MTMAFAHDGFAIRLMNLGARCQHGVIRAEAHRAALVADVALRHHQVDHWIMRRGVELGGVGIGHAQHVTGELNGHHLHSEAQAEARKQLFTRVLRCGNLAFDTTGAEAARNDHSIKIGEAASGQQALDLFGLNPVDLHLGAMLEASVTKALRHRKIGILQIDVLANETDLHRGLRRFYVGDNFLPRTHVERSVDLQYFADHNIKTFVVQDQRQLVNVAGVGRIHHGTLVYVAQVADLALQVQAQGLFAAAHDHVGLDTAAAQFSNAVLSWLRLLLATWPDERHQRDVHVAHVVAANFFTELTNRLEERQDLNVANGATHFSDHDVDIIGSEALDASLDFVGDVRDDLHSLSEIVTTALSCQYGLIDAACSGVAVAAQWLVDKALVVTEVEVGLAAIIGHEHLAVLERVHRARIDIDIRIKFLHGDPKATHLQQTTQ